MSVTKKHRKIGKIAAQKAISLYQTLSVNRPPSCRYVPSCSEYGYEAIENNSPGSKLVGRKSWVI